MGTTRFASEYAEKVLASELRETVIRAVERSLGDSLLLSGGLDTSIVLSALSSLEQWELLKSRFHAYTVVLEGSPSPDLAYSQMVTAKYGIRQTICRLNFSELEDYLMDVVKVLKSFDPMEIRNSVVLYAGLKLAKIDGFRAVMTGDASDELFAGYSFVYNLQPDMGRATLIHLWDVMHFSSMPLASSLGIQAKLPFLDYEVKKFAMARLGWSDLVGKHNGETYGKFILRRAFENSLPPEIVWRKKAPIEVGSGTAILPSIYSNILKDEEFEARRKEYLLKDRVKLRDKEQLRYYEIYRELFGSPPPPDRSRKVCPACSMNVPDGAVFCTICGEYPI